MIIGNLKSRRDYDKKMGEYKNLLDVAISNEKLLQTQQDQINYNSVNGLPTAPPPPERTPTEITQDVNVQRNMLINSLANLKINYEVIRHIITELTVDDIIILNAHFPMLKSDIEKRFNVKLLTSDILLAYLLQYIELYNKQVNAPNPKKQVNNLLDLDDEDFGAPINSFNDDFNDVIKYDGPRYDDDGELIGTNSVAKATAWLGFTEAEKNKLKKLTVPKLKELAEEEYKLTYNIARPIKADMIHDIEKVINERRHNESGSGLKRNRKGRKKQVGRGLTRGLTNEEKESHHKMFGNYKINIPKLKANILHLAYKCGSPVRGIQARYITDEFKDFIEHFLESGKFSESMYKLLSDTEKRHFFDVVKGSGIYKKIDIKLTNPFYKEEHAELNRFEILRGEIEGGNDNREMIKEMKTLLLKLSKNGKVSRREALQTIEELTALGY
jgi:hypothetical protein